MKKQVVFACDIGGSKLLCGFVTPEGEIVDTEKVTLSPNTTTDIIESRIFALYELLCQRNPECSPTLCGMTIPGLADAENGVWQYACFSGIADYPIAARVSARLLLPVYVENDVNACALAEKVYGTYREANDFLWVTVSNGVGGGLVLGGAVYRGAFGGAGEFGHIVVEENGPLCPCGHRGCLEAVAAGPAISRRYASLTGRSCSAAEIAALARGGEPEALAVLRKTGEYIGKGLGKAASLLNLELYVLGGGVMQSFDLMEADIRRAFAEEAFERPNRSARIVTTSLRYEAGLLGAAAVAREGARLTR